LESCSEQRFENPIPRSEDEKKITLHEPPLASISLKKLNKGQGFESDIKLKKKKKKRKKK
jgi:hypothetical protein